MSATVASFSKKKIDLVITLGSIASTTGGVTTTTAPAPFVETGTKTVRLSGLRCSALINKTAGSYQGELDLRVFGLTDSIMRRICQNVGRVGTVLRHDQVQVLAGDETGMVLAYLGSVAKFPAWLRAGIIV